MPSTSSRFDPDKEQEAPNVISHWLKEKRRKKQAKYDASKPEIPEEAEEIHYYYRENRYWVELFEKTASLYLQAYGIMFLALVIPLTMIASEVSVVAAIIVFLAGVLALLPYKYSIARQTADYYSKVWGVSKYYFHVEVLDSLKFVISSDSYSLPLSQFEVMNIHKRTFWEMVLFRGSRTVSLHFSGGLDDSKLRNVRNVKYAQELKLILEANKRAIDSGARFWEQRPSL